MRKAVDAELAFTTAKAVVVVPATVMFVPEIDIAVVK
jgi:hypothetical protein